MQWLTTSIAAILIGAGVVAAQAEGLFRDDFDDGEIDGWHAVSGEWEVADGELRQASIEWGRHTIVRRIRVREGVVQAAMRVTTPSRLGWGCFGLVLRYPGTRTPTYVRVGAYGHIQLAQAEERVLGPVAVEVGRTYQLLARIADGSVTVELDGRRIGTAELSDPGPIGFVGLYTENGAAFDDFEVRGDFREDPLVTPALRGTPALELQFAHWLPVHAGPREAPAGAIELYYRNAGSGDAQLASVAVGGRRVWPDEQPPWLAWARQRPHRLAPGAVGQLHIHVSALPEALIKRLTDRPDGPVPLAVEWTPRGGDTLRATVDVASAVPALQVNFMAFSADLRTVYAYLQNNPAVQAGRAGAGAAAAPIRIESIALNGADVTAAARLGADAVGADVVPVEIRLDAPLVAGTPVVVTVTGPGDVRAGHCLRAFPSRFDVVAILNGTQPRADYAADLYGHGVTAMSAPAGLEALAAAGLDGLAFLPFIGRSPSFLHHALHFERHGPVGIIVDEVDKPWGQPAAKLVGMLAGAEAYLRAEGRTMPLQCWNAIHPKRCARSGHLTVADAVMHAYGYYMCPATGPGFGRVRGLERREYRRARRPFWPYFRDTEIPVPCDPQTKQVLPLNEAFQRTLTPGEARWMQFGTIIQGAKSFMHWGYWGLLKKSHYYVDGPCLRIGLGAIAGDRVGPYRIPDRIVAMLRSTWDEMGRINAELRTIGPLVARSDVSYRARVLASTPALNARDEPAAEAAALVSGLDALVLVVLNHGLDTGASPFPATGPISNPEPPRFEPLEDVRVALALPSWLKPRHVLSVDHAGVTPFTPQRRGDTLVFDFDRLVVTRVLVITSSDDVRDGCLQRHGVARGLLERMAVEKPVPNEDWEG